jgi:hypothetical protein
MLAVGRFLLQAEPLGLARSRACAWGSVCWGARAWAWRFGDVGALCQLALKLTFITILLFYLLQVLGNETKVNKNNNTMKCGELLDFVRIDDGCLK